MFLESLKKELLDCKNSYEKYEILIKIANLENLFDPLKKTLENQILNCQSRVWIYTNDQKVYVMADSKIIQAYANLLISEGSKVSANEILDKYGIKEFYSSLRLDGLKSLVSKSSKQ